MKSECAKAWQWKLNNLSGVELYFCVAGPSARISRWRGNRSKSFNVNKLRNKSQLINLSSKPDHKYILSIVRIVVF